jgi:hypothetical protein
MHLVHDREGTEDALACGFFHEEDKIVVDMAVERLFKIFGLIL